MFDPTVTEKEHTVLIHFYIPILYPETDTLTKYDSKIHKCTVYRLMPAQVTSSNKRAPPVFLKINFFGGILKIIFC